MPLRLIDGFPAKGRRPVSKSGFPARDERPVDPADRARVFTVHLRNDAVSALRGRITHLATGDSAYFDSGDELVLILQRAGRST